MTTEYGIVFANEPDELHRGPMTEAEARVWLDEWAAEGGRPGAFRMVVREVGEWKLAVACPHCGTPYTWQMKFNGGNPQRLPMSECTCEEERVDQWVDELLAKRKASEEP